MKGYEIVNRAKEFKNYKYWYGGKREIATVALAKELKAANPSVWTDAYYQTALKDINGSTRVCDCSGLVCYCYGIGDINSTAIKNKYRVWTGKPKPGMIGWKSGHVAIISDTDGHIIEMRSQAYDYQDTRYRLEAGLNTLLYDPNIDYDAVETDGDNTGESVGWHSDNAGWWYRHTKGIGEDTYYHDCYANINGHGYLFDSEGYIYYISSILRVQPTDNEGWIF